MTERKRGLSFAVSILAAIAAWPAAAQAGPVDLLTNANVQLDGAVAGDFSGSSVAGAGDVNGDGRPDIVTGAPSAGNNGRGGSGSVYVVYGSATPGKLDLATLTAVQGFRIDGAVAGELTGGSVAGAGDVNGDGRADVITGAANAGNNGRAGSGSAYVVYGSASPGTVDLAALTASQGFRIDGAAVNDGLATVAGAGDVNGDGRADVIVGGGGPDNNGRNTSGSAYVIYGSASPPNVDLAALTASQGFRIDGAVANDGLATVAGAGDVNGDGRSDVIAGTASADNNSRTNSGSAWVVYGSASAGNVDLATLTPSQGFRVDGASANDFMGAAAGAGDVNGDGRADVITGAGGADNNGRSGSGSAYVVYGSASPGNVDLAGLTPAQGFRIDGAATNNVSGTALAGAGDLDGDGRADVITGAFGAGNNGRTQSGSTYVVYSTFLPAIAYEGTALGQVGEAFEATPTRFHATGPRSVTVSPTLPPGLSINSSTGRIAGTPTSPGISTHTVTLTDSSGTTSTRLRIGIVNAQGPPGQTGQTGQTGAAGTQGSPGSSGPAGAQGTGGQTGGPGRDGAPGPTGPQGAAGRDATVTCKVPKAKKGTVKVTCTVKQAGAARKSSRASWRLARGKHTVARGVTTVRRGRIALDLAHLRGVRRGRYVLTLKIGSTVVREVVHVR